MPGEKSLQMGQYYAHPQNSFWFIMGHLVGFDPAIDYEQRVDRIRQSGICVWDVLQSCTRQGSLDASIDKSSEIANDFNFFLSEHNNISAIFFNGAKAEQLFKKYISPTLGERQQCSLYRLPSTSPAHAAMSRSAKLEKWGVIRAKLSH